MNNSFKKIYSPRFITLTLVITLAILLTSCLNLSSNSTANLTEYIDPTGYKISYPEGWTATDITNGKQFSGSLNAVPLESATIAISSITVNLVTYINTMASTSQNLDNITSISTSNVTIDNKAGVRLEFILVSSGVYTKSITVATQDTSTFYVINYTNINALSLGNTINAEDIINSFKFPTN